MHERGAVGPPAHAQAGSQVDGPPASSRGARPVHDRTARIAEANLALRLHEVPQHRLEDDGKRMVLQSFSSTSVSSVIGFRHQFGGATRLR